MDEIQKDKILSFTKDHRLAVIATTDGAKPESALIAFAQTEDLEIIFGTSDTTRKYQNLQKNNHVSFVIGLDDRDVRATLQYEGVATELQGESIKEYSDILIAKNPMSAKYLHDSHQRYFLVRPAWIRYANYSAVPEDVFEIFF